jgi:sialate O-acetylesterase
MHRRYRPLLAAAAVAFAAQAAPLSAEVRLPACFGDGMVLQRDQPIPVWGWDAPGQKVTVRLDAAAAEATADANGLWRLQLPARGAGGPYAMEVVGSSARKFGDVLVGEVWLCSGQSNMEWTVRMSSYAEQEIAAADFPQIRCLKVDHRPAKEPAADVPSSGWQACSPATAADFTAVGYFFAREVHRELDVPVGILSSNWGGTRIEPWIPPVGFEQTPALSAIAEKLAESPAVDAEGNIDHQTPLALYNGMIHPLVPYALRGALWYQGESNNGEGMLYHEKMKALINGWRHAWGRPEMSFYFVQLAPFRYGRDPLDLPGIWEAQAATLAVPRTGMVVTTDITTINDIHPPNKQDVGRRLARWALARDYGQTDVATSGPMFRDMAVEDDRIRVHFRHAEGGLSTRDGEAPSWFEIAGEDGKFVPATAVLEGDAAIVRADGVAAPRHVRFGWNQVAEPNLINAAGLPASPFRTDAGQ